MLRVCLFIVNYLIHFRDYLSLYITIIKSSYLWKNLFPVMFSMIHEHAGGDKVDPHVRCHICLSEDGVTAFLDCDFEIFNSLGKFQSKTKELAT